MCMVVPPSSVVNSKMNVPASLKVKTLDESKPEIPCVPRLTLAGKVNVWETLATVISNLILPNLPAEGNPVKLTDRLPLLVTV